MDSALIRFLKNEPESLGALLVLIVVGIALNIGWMVAVPMMMASSTGGYRGYGREYGYQFSFFWTKPFSDLTLPEMAQMCAEEEAVARIFPLWASVRWFETSTLLLVALMMSILFGLTHVPFAKTPLQNFIATAGSGLLFCTLFLKAGGMNGKFLKPSFVVIIVHLAYNLAAQNRLIPS